MMKSLESFVDSENEIFQAYGAFQIIVLARVIVDVDQVIDTHRVLLPNHIYSLKNTTPARAIVKVIWISMPTLFLLFTAIAYIVL